MRLESRLRWLNAWPWSWGNGWLLAEGLLRRRDWLRLGLANWLWWARGNKWDAVAGSTKWRSQSIAFFILLTRLSRSGIQAPLGLERLLNFLGVGELEVADFSWDGGALSNRVELGDKLGLEAAGLLGVQVTGFLRDIDEGSDDLIVALLRSLLKGAASTADLNGQLLALGVTDKLARRLLHILGGARGLIYRLAHLLSLAIALLNGKITH